MTQRPVERDEEARWTFQVLMRRLDPWKLVFFDETSAQMGLRPSYAYAPIGQRTHGEFLRNFGPNRTLLSAMSLEGMLPGLLVEGGVSREVFEYYLREVLLPVLSPGQVVVLDNFVVHRGEGVAALARAAGVELLFLPAYSPDLNPIEFAFSKLKALWKQAEARVLGALSMAVKRALDAVTLADIQGFFRGSGYATQYL